MTGSQRPQMHPRRPRILMVANYYTQYGGISAVVENLAAGLTSEGYSVSLHNVGGFLPGAWTRAVGRRLGRYARLWGAARRCELIHAHCSARWGFLPAVVAAAAATLYRKPLVVTYHSTHHQIPFTQKSAAVRFVARRARAITTPFRVTAEPFGRYGTRALAIANILDLEHWTFRQRESFGPRLVWTRNVYHPDLAIEAFQHVRRAIPQATLVMCGRAATAEAQAQYVGTPGLSLMGLVPRLDLPGVLDQADVYVNTADHDTFGYAIYEAMARGLAIVSVESPALRDMAGDATVCFARQSTPESLAQAIESALADQEATRARALAGCELVRSFSWEALFPIWQDVYDRALAPGPGAGA